MLAVAGTLGILGYTVYHSHFIYINVNKCKSRNEDLWMTKEPTQYTGDSDRDADPWITTAHPSECIRILSTSFVDHARLFESFRKGQKDAWKPGSTTETLLAGNILENLAPALCFESSPYWRKTFVHYTVAADTGLDCSAPIRIAWKSALSKGTCIVIEENIHSLCRRSTGGWPGVAPCLFTGRDTIWFTTQRRPKRAIVRPRQLLQNPFFQLQWYKRYINSSKRIRTVYKLTRLRWRAMSLVKCGSFRTITSMIFWKLTAGRPHTWNYLLAEVTDNGVSLAAQYKVHWPVYVAGFPSTSSIQYQRAKWICDNKRNNVRGVTQRTVINACLTTIASV